MKYVIPAPRNKRLKRWLDRNVSDGIVAVEDDWGVYGAVKHGSSTERVETTVVGLPGDPDDDQYGFGNAHDEQSTDGETEPVPFYTNKPVDDELVIDRRRTKLEIERYSRRGRIETSYSKIKEFAPMTTSKDFTVRLWHFGFAVLLYNIWPCLDARKRGFQFLSVDPGVGVESPRRARARSAGYPR